MSSRVVSFAQIESICLLSGLEIASAKHQNLNWNSTESNQIHLKTLDFSVFIIRWWNCLGKASKSQLKFNWIKSNPSEYIWLQCIYYQASDFPQQNIKISTEIWTESYQIHMNKFDLNVCIDSQVSELLSVLPQLLSNWTHLSPLNQFRPIWAH